MMNKPIIIDGVDVSECCCYEFQRCLWSKKYYEIIPVPLCKEIKDCYYKQLQQLKKENERLKAFKRECLKPIFLPDIDEPEIINKYKQALEEIREMCISHEKAEKIVMANEIITKINEVLKDEY